MKPLMLNDVEECHPTRAEFLRGTLVHLKYAAKASIRRYLTWRGRLHGVWVNLESAWLCLSAAWRGRW